MRKMPIKQRRRWGPAAFTLVDMVITTLIIGILAATATPKFTATLHRMRAEAGAKRIQADLGLARQNAISRSAALGVSFALTTDSYAIPDLPDLDRPGRSYVVELNSSPYHTSLISADLGGDSDVQFDRFGKPDSGGSIIVESGGFQQSVTIDGDSGRVTIP
jgi:type II secretory pathway pseudopilin PulG